MLVLALLMSSWLQQAGLEKAAGVGSPSPRPTSALADRRGDELECRVQKVTGSHFTARYCLTADEWSRLHDFSMQALYGRTESHPNASANAEGMNPH